MVRRLLYLMAGIALATAAFLWQSQGAVNPPSAPPGAAEWENLIRERIKLPEGLVLDVFARGLGHPRLMQMTATGDIIVSDTGGRVLLVKADRNDDGKSDGTIVMARGLDFPHGLVLEGATLYVAEQTRVVKYDFDGASLGNPRVILDGIPSGGHSTRTLRRGPDGYFYLTVGSSCNACVESNPWRAAMLRFLEGGKPEVFATGLRNTVGFDWQPGTGQLYGVDNGRDNLGDDVPDDEVNLIREGGNFGWPYMHGFGVPDPSLYAARPPGFASIAPVFGLGAHVAPLSIHFRRARPEVALIAEHGSWNRSVKAGYRLVTLDLAASPPRQDVFLDGCAVKEVVICRPVDTLEAGDGSLFVSDDYAGVLYHIHKAS
jgi:glucose/arabinose dehydrogenase